MIIITRQDVKDTAKRETLVEERLNDMGVGPEMQNGVELRAATKAYYLKLLQEHLGNSDDVLFTEYFDNCEGFAWGFVEGYEVCLRSRK